MYIPIDLCCFHIGQKSSPPPWVAQRLMAGQIPSISNCECMAVDVHLYQSPPFLSSGSRKYYSAIGKDAIYGNTMELDCHVK